jgi:hypothetical protein
VAGIAMARRMRRAVRLDRDGHSHSGGGALLAAEWRVLGLDACYRPAGDRVLASGLGWAGCRGTNGPYHLVLEPISGRNHGPIRTSGLRI